MINQVNHDRFRSLFAFQNQRTYENYTDLEDFVGIYPFVDYQFELFHDAMRDSLTLTRSPASMLR